MLTVTIQEPLAVKMRQLAESHGMSLSELLKDAILVHEAQVTDGQEPESASRTER